MKVAVVSVYGISDRVLICASASENFSSETLDLLNVITQVRQNACCSLWEASQKSFLIALCLPNRFVAITTTQHRLAHMCESALVKTSLVKTPSAL